MKWLNQLERRFGAWTFPQFPLFLVTANALVYFLALTKPEFIGRLELDPTAVRQGEFWRVFTFLLIPPSLNADALSMVFMAIWLYVMYQFATALEQAWGEFRFQFFYFLGAFSTIIAAVFIVHQSLSNAPLNTTLFLAVAALFPETLVLLFYILPVKMKWIAWGIWVMLGWSLVFGGFTTRIAVLASLVNYVVFFGPDHWHYVRLRWQVFRNRRRFPPTEK